MSKDQFNTEADTKFVYFDIETLPSDNECLLGRIHDNLKPPANIKKKESIDTWWAEKSYVVATQEMAKTSFNGGRGRVACISANINGETYSYGASLIERETIEVFFSSLPKSNVTLVGHNITGFDIPFLTKRAICLGVKLPNKWVWPRKLSPYGGNKGVFDTMLDWDSNRDKYTSLDELSNILGIAGKIDMDGSQVANAWAAGNYKKVIDYCADDVELTRKIHGFFMKAGY